MTLVDANIGEEYIIKNIATDDEELNSFLFSLGCYSGEPITVVSRKKRNCTVSIKDARYNIDNELAAAILIQCTDYKCVGILVQQMWQLINIRCTGTSVILEIDIPAVL